MFSLATHRFCMNSKLWHNLITLGKKQYQKAVEFYTAAIEINPLNAIYYSNRSFANYNLESYGLAIGDATKAIEIDGTYAKAFYRRSQAYIALSKFSMALKDLESLRKLEPENLSVPKLINRCANSQMQFGFARALSIKKEEKTPWMIFDEWDEDLTLSNDKLLPGRDTEYTKSDIENVIMHFKDCNILNRFHTGQILKKAHAIFKEQPNIVHIEKPNPNRKVTICGDIHGQFYDLLNIFERNGYPSDENVYIFNGDFVDRGSFSLEVILVMLMYKIVYPHSFYMTRGNHETHSMNSMYGFEGEVLHKYSKSSTLQIVSSTVYRAFRDLFEALPLCHIIGDKIFITHGGVPCDGAVTLEDINKINRFCQPPDSGVMCDLLWADPHSGLGLLPSNRGISNQFGSDVTERFLSLNGLDCVVRSHEMKNDGYEVMHNGKCLTIFSAPNYCDTMGNKGAYIKVKEDLSYEFEEFTEVPHPNVRSMQYANQMMNSFM